MAPPVDVGRLLRAVADVERADWPQLDVDAMVLRRPGLRPQVFYRSVGNRGRERFTLAHELGHVVIPWHIGSAACVAAGAPEADAAAISDEDQADVFASALLAPEAWLRGLVDQHGDQMGAVLESLEDAQMSTTASLRALRTALPPGWAFQINRQTAAYVSPGTRRPSAESGEELRALLDAPSHDRGVVRLGDNDVSWWRLFEVQVMPAPDTDPRSDTELLRGALAPLGHDARSLQHLVQSANGTVGGGARDAAGRDADVVYGGLVHRFREDPKFAPVVETDSFRAWLARKTRKRVAG